ncbi:MAG: TolC family protein [Candidatus Omnitrophica bacterium]|nr:TolC family protein [Candidatus Omnitrophota bacterium]
MKRKIITFSIILLFICLLACKVGAEEALTWQDCLKEAAKNNPDLISSGEAVKQKEAAKTITASGLYPQIDADLDASTTKKTTVTSGSSTTATTDSYSYGLSATQLIFDGRKTANEIKAASQDIKAAQESYRFTSSEVRYNLRSAFVNLLKEQELIKVIEEIVKIRRNSLMLISLRYESGLEHKGALLTAEANVAQANFELSQAKRDLELMQVKLNKEMGREEFEPIIVKGDFEISDTVKEKPDFDELINNNPSVLQAIAKKNSASFDIKSAYANFSPQLSGTAGTSKSGSKWPAKGKQWNLGLGISMPIFEGGLRVAQVSQAQSAYRQAQADERSVIDSAIVSLEQAWVELQDAVETVGVQQKSLEAAVERSNIAEAQYSAGFIDFDSWTIIENNLVTVKKSFLNAQANVLLAEANWVQAKGETLEYE